MTKDMATSRSKKRATLGVDLGTSAVKCVVVADGQVLASSTAELGVSSPHPGWSEQDPAAWRKAATLAILSARSASRLASSEIVGIGLSGQMHGAVTLDKGGLPLRPAILWNDNRSINECHALADSLPQIGQIAGIGPLPGFTAPKLMWMKHHEPDLFSKIGKVILPKDYLAYWLTGEISTDTSDAAGTLWLDQAARTWSKPIIEASEVDPEWLPSLKSGFEPSGELRPSVAKALGLEPGITVFVGGGDAATGAIALGAAAPGRCMMSLGTSGQLLVVDGSYAPAPAKFVHAYCHTIPDTWFRMAAMLNGARPLAWFAQVLGIGVEQFIVRSQEADPSRIPLFLPYLTGERSPHGDPNIRGSFYGLDDATGAPEMARAVVEAVAFSMADALKSFGSDAVLETPIPVIGGGSRSPVVLQTLADALSHPVARADIGEAGAALGACRLAEVGAGLRSASELSDIPVLEAEYQPRPAPDLMQRFSKYQELYRALKPLASAS